MVDVDRRMNVHAHVAGLKRLSVRASKVTAPTCNGRKGCFSFSHFARKVIDHLRKCQVQIAEGLSEEEFARIEAAFGFSFPPDLRAVLKEGLPVGVGFPDWRCGGLKQLRLRLNLPTAGLCCEVARGRFWAKQWGPRPSHAEEAMNVARAALRKAPILVPVYNHCYISSSPNLAGNPVFFVYQNDVFYRGCDLANFFQREAFVTDCCEVPTDLSSLGAIHGRVGSLDSGADWVWEKESSSSWIETPSFPSRLARNDSFGEPTLQFGDGMKVSTEADSKMDGEAPEWNREEQLRDLEAWGRNVDFLARRCDPYKRKGERPRMSVDGIGSYHAFRSACSPSPNVGNSPKLTKDDIFRCGNLHIRHPSGESFALITSSSAAKSARRIDFWSDLAERRHSLNHATAEQLFSSLEVDMDLAEESLKELGWENRRPSNLKERCIPDWMAEYLEDMAAILRGGGWKEDDIDEIVSVCEPNEDGQNFFLDKQSVLESMVLHVNLLSDALRRAGWSTQEVAEAMDVEISLQKERRGAPKIPIQLTRRIGKLAECVAKS